MALLTLTDIGKIYVSEGNVTVGIRGVNLSFDRGEFVAVTGKSGSGKSTLLNVISGMDSYEEGELTVEGHATSHYLQPDWEEYREKYISFIFQDYNIIDSFTVLQNVELALMHIEDKKERRARAMELIERVGLSSHKNHKGSKLSGGQKQRTVIARALAKDSPIILADEPTGNLDSVTSREIIELLYEVSRDKLLIVVTHSFDDFEEYATRHIRIFDGAIESDRVVKESRKSEEESEVPQHTQSAIADRRKEYKKQIKDGVTLGRAIFISKPRLSVFICLLMIVGTLGLFFSTSLCGSATELFSPYYMFNNIDGRMVLAKQSGEVITDAELDALTKKYGAVRYLHYDVLLDEGGYNELAIYSADTEEYTYFSADTTYGKSYGDNILGRYPEHNNEVLLYLPISYQPLIGKDSIKTSEIFMSGTEYKIVGVKYFYDNNLTAECLFTEEGFRTATAIYFLTNYTSTITVTATDSTHGAMKVINLYGLTTDFNMPSDKVYINSKDYQSLAKDGSFSTNIKYMSIYETFNYFYGTSGTTYVFEHTFDEDDITDVKPTVNESNPYGFEDYLIVSDELVRDIAERVLEKSYVQASIFFENHKAAHLACDGLKEEGYIAVPSDTTYEPEALVVIMSIIASLMMAAAWILAIVFLSYFITICSSRSLEAFSADMAIMRSMGIPVKVIRIGMYVRMLISLIPAVIFMVIAAILVFTVPKFNEFFVYLYPWQYALMIVGMLAITTRATYKQIAKLFGESVKKSLKGGDA